MKSKKSTIKLKKGDKLKIMLFFKKDSRPEIYVVEYQNEFHYGNLLAGNMIIANENMETPEVLICYKMGKNPQQDLYLSMAIIDGKPSAKGDKK
jgi:hypothetical protein